MPEIYGRNLDLNLLRVFVAVAEHRSVTRAASQLYLTQPAVSAALRRLTEAVGTPLFARQGRGLVLTARGARLAATVRPHLGALLEAALSPAGFEPKTSDRIFRVGFADAIEGWLLPRLLAELEEDAPHMRIIAVPVTFRSVGDAFNEGRVDVAVTVVDELPASIRRATAFVTDYVCLFDPRHVRFGKRPSERAYFAAEHVIVSYNGDLRGIIEDFFGKQRRVRCSVPSFASLGALIDGSALVATVPRVVAEDVIAVRPKLATSRLPKACELPGGPVDMLWPAASDDDPASKLIRERLSKLLATRSINARAKRRSPLGR